MMPVPVREEAPQMRRLRRGVVGPGRWWRNWEGVAAMP